MRRVPRSPKLGVLRERPGAKVVLGASARPRDVFELVQRHRVTHIHVVPALLIR